MINTKRIVILVAVLAVVAITLVLYKNSSVVYSELNDLKLIPVDEHFTELYFVTYPTLSPSDVVVGNTIPFSFEVHNVEGTTTDYLYQVYLKTTNGDQHVIDDGHIVLQDGASIIKNETYKIATTQLGNVVVYLKSIDQYIYFSIPNKNLILDETPIINATTTATSTQ